MPSKDEVAERLARDNYFLDEAVRRIYRLVGGAEADEREPIKLLLVSDDTVATGIVPLHFPPHVPNGIPYPFVVVEVTPDELDRLERGELALPAGWSLGAPYARPAELEGAVP